MTTIRRITTYVAYFYIALACIVLFGLFFNIAEANSGYYQNTPSIATSTEYIYFDGLTDIDENGLLHWDMDSENFVPATIPDPKIYPESGLIPYVIFSGDSSNFDDFPRFQYAYQHYDTSTSGNTSESCEAQETDSVCNWIESGSRDYYVATLPALDPTDEVYLSGLLDNNATRIYAIGLSSTDIRNTVTDYASMVAFINSLGEPEPVGSITIGDGIPDAMIFNIVEPENNDIIATTTATSTHVDVSVRHDFTQLYFTDIDDDFDEIEIRVTDASVGDSTQYVESENTFNFNGTTTKQFNLGVGSWLVTATVRNFDTRQSFMSDEVLFSVGNNNEITGVGFDANDPNLVDDRYQSEIELFDCDPDEEWFCGIKEFLWNMFYPTVSIGSKMSNSFNKLSTETFISPVFDVYNSVDNLEAIPENPGNLTFDFTSLSNGMGNITVINSESLRDSIENYGINDYGYLFEYVFWIIFVFYLIFRTRDIIAHTS